MAAMQGKRTGIVDLTRGETGAPGALPSCGQRKPRQPPRCSALSVRENLGLKDGLARRRGQMPFTGPDWGAFAGTGLANRIGQCASRPPHRPRPGGGVGAQRLLFSLAWPGSRPPILMNVQCPRAAPACACACTTYRTGSGNPPLWSTFRRCGGQRSTPPSPATPRSSTCRALPKGAIEIPSASDLATPISTPDFMAVVRGRDIDHGPLYRRGLWRGLRMPQTPLGFTDLGGLICPEECLENAKRPVHWTRRFFVGWLMGLEPTTLGTTNRCSNQLSYSHRMGRQR